MDEDYTIAYVDRPEESAWGIIGQGISDYNRQQAGDDTPRLLCFALQGPEQVIVGGVWAPSIGIGFI